MRSNNWYVISNVTVAILMQLWVDLVWAAQPCPTVCPDGSRPYFCVCPVIEEEPEYSRPQPRITVPERRQTSSGDCNASRRPDGGSDCRPKDVVTPEVEITTRAGSLISGRYQDNGDGTVTDVTTNLMWKRCAEGQNWTGSTCAGKGIGMTCDAAMPNAQQKSWGRFAGHSDWQMPTRKQLRTLVWCSNGTPQKEAWDNTCSGKNSRNGTDYQSPTIDLKAFPNTELEWFWSIPPNAFINCVGLHFNYGADDWKHYSAALRVRLVRGGQ